MRTRTGCAKHFRFDCRIEAARFSSEHGHWVISLDGQEQVTARCLLLALGPHSRPVEPRFAGKETFAGVSFHSARWPADADLHGKRVAVIGTGASAVQIVPAVAPEVEHLYVFQRSAPWILPRGQRQYTRFERWAFRRLPWTLRLKRSLIFWSHELIGLGFIRQGLINRILMAVAGWKRRRAIRDPELRARLAPDYMIGCKRAMVSDDYYPAFNRDNVTLVTDPITAMDRDGLVCGNTTRWDVDAVVYATGFVVADADGYLPVIGADGRSLEEVWTRDGAAAYMGTTISGFPNLGMLLGPNSGLGHSSVVHIVESQLRYLMRYLEALDALGPGATLDVKPDVQRRYNAQVQERLGKTVWGTGCKSWYLDRKGRNVTVFPGLNAGFRRALASLDLDAYEQRFARPEPPARRSEDLVAVEEP